MDVGPTLASPAQSPVDDTDLVDPPTRIAGRAPPFRQLRSSTLSG